jgi:hypothetical protein
VTELCIRPQAVVVDRPLSGSKASAGGDNSELESVLEPPMTFRAPKRIALFFVFATAIAAAAPAEGIPQGTYVFFPGTQSHLDGMRLLCGPDGTCRLQHDGQANSLHLALTGKIEDVVLDAITPLSKSDLAPLQDSVDYLYGHQDDNVSYIGNEELRFMMLPVLKSRPTIQRCWDLNFQMPNERFVCEIDTAHSAPAGSLFWFGRADVNNGFGKHIIVQFDLVSGSSGSR